MRGEVDKKRQKREVEERLRATLYRQVPKK